ncbi:CPBP family intramembrane metalloprotease [Pseudonocardia sp. RS11V-5]|uniref:CPBP family intramembrane glutamic endopeptidase n=1 Tax=Pseudonocardia terrae TaxID=2905831 RepID=UPI001E47B9A9|nr:type II CAAX endopeptidase family protein [Pseudonocardia terrae]MCE3553016.1 CPBP family intramembrane metalloprotease [Pseudonocardia terrae]
MGQPDSTPDPPSAPPPTGPFPSAPPQELPQYAQPQGPAGAPEPPVVLDPPPHRWGIGAYVLVEVLFLGSSFLIAALLAGRGGPSVAAVILGLSVPTLLAAGTALLVTRVRGNGPRIDLGLRGSARDIGAGLLWGLGGLVVSVPASLVYVAIVGPDNATTAVGQAFDGIRVGWPVALGVFVLVAFVAPVCEEIVYRGLLWGAVTKHGANRWVAFAITTLLFAMAHFELTRTPLLLVVALPIGLARAFTGRLPASIVAHQVNNLLPALGLALALTGGVPASL